MKREVVITGIGLVTPLRPLGTVDEFWRALCSGEDAVRQMTAPLLDAGRQWPMAGIALPGTVPPEEKFCLIAEHALSAALRDSGLESSRSAGLAVGTVLGNILAKERRMLEADRRRESPSGCADDGLVFPVRFLSARHGLTGPLLTVSTACASGTDAIGIAARKVAGGEADAMIAGGVDVLSDFALFGFHALQALTPDKVRPFSKNRTGLALGEGAAFIALETREHAGRRGAKVYGKVLGYASRSDAHHLTGPHREGRGLASAITAALSDAGMSPRQVDYINAHGTGTPYNDLMETKAVRKAFGEAAHKVPISSTKSMLGHSFGAAGAIEAICCLLALKHGRVPPTINYGEPDAECDLDYVPNVARLHPVRVAMSLSAGFGGQNAALVVGAL